MIVLVATRSSSTRVWNMLGFRNRLAQQHVTNYIESGNMIELGWLRPTKKIQHRKRMSRTANKRGRESTTTVATSLKKVRMFDNHNRLQSVETKDELDLDEPLNSSSALLEHLTQLLLPKLVDIENSLFLQYQDRLSELLQVQFEHFTQVQLEQLSGPEPSYLC